MLTGVDFRNEPDPAGAWWTWWDGVVHDDALSWFLSALARAGLSPPPRDAFEGAGRPEARLLLCDALARPEPQLVERARRELARMLGRDPPGGEPLGRELETVPPRGPDRDHWIAGLRKSLAERREK